jgi:tartrate dehydrogenase/decarboxylase / D-malate dehydrogenase
MSDVVHRVVAIPGDGIGKEVVPAAQRVLERAAELHGFGFEWDERPWGCERFLETGSMMPEDALEQLAAYDAIFLGAVGAPGVPDHVSLWGLLIPIRRTFDQYLALRPIRRMPGVQSPLASDEEIDIVVFRENVEGEYSEIGGRMYSGLPGELATQQAIFTRRGTERLVRQGFELAARRKGTLVSATKSNGIIHTMPFWDEVVEDVAADYPSVEVERVLIDALCARVVQRPSSIDVIVASNLFGDILSDLTAAIAGSIGIAPGANINPEREHPSMFEPVHGSAPDIAGKGIANPVGQTWTGALMLDHLGHGEAARAVEAAIETVLADPANHTGDLGGDATTEHVTDALIGALG